MKELTQEELADLILKNKESMYRLAYSILRNDADAQDAVSESIVLAFENRTRIQKKNSAKPWLMQIVANASKTMYAKSSRVVLSDQMEQFERSEPFRDDAVWAVVMELSEEFREIVVLYYYEQFTTREIGRMLKIPEGTVKSRLSRAREKLLKIIE